MKLTDEMLGRLRGGLTKTALAQELGVSRTSVRRAMDAIERANGTRAAAPGAGAVARKPSKIGVSVDDFLRERDPVEKMRATLAEARKLVIENTGRLIKNHELRKTLHCGDPKLWADMALDPDEGLLDMQFMWGEEWYWAAPEMVSEICAAHRQARPMGSAKGSTKGNDQ